MAFRLGTHRGTVTVILLGLISVIVVFAFSLSRRLSSHTQLLTIGDHTQIARYYLESYTGDVIRQIGRQANDPTSDIYNLFRQAGTGEFTIPSDAFQPNSLLAGLKKELGIEHVGAPKINVRGQKALPYPEIVQLPEKLRGLEKRGYLSISCSIKFNKRPYTMAVRSPFLVAMRMTPVLREFVLFCDRLHLEQPRPFGSQDRINLTFTKGSEHPKDVPANYSAYKGQPWVLWPTPNVEGNKDKCGRVFLGADDKPIYLNLAGEKNFQGYMSDLWQVFPEWIKVNRKGDKFQLQPIFLDNSGKPISLRGIDVPLKLRNHMAKIGILGFCHEIADDAEDGIFSNSFRTLRDVMGPDPAFQALINDNPQALALASSLKLFGKNGESETADGVYYGPAREVFGRVFGRFLMITFFEYPSAQGGGQSLPYNANWNYQPPPFATFNNVSQVQFTPAEPGQQYGDFMSRVVSGGLDAGGPALDTYLCVNPESKKTRRPFGYNEFAPADGLRLKGRFDAFGPAWFAIDPKKRPGDPSLSTVQSRIMRTFANQAAFTKAVGDGVTKFHVDGVVYVKGSLTLKDITTTDIRGGVVLVEQDITLGNVTRGIRFDQDNNAMMTALIEKIGKLKQEELLTFVSLSGRPIRLAGDKQVGVHLISMNEKVGVPCDQVTWEAVKRPVFCGGIAVNTPNLSQRVREFGRAGEDPIFFYVPAMADPTPAVAVGVKSYMEGYRLSADEVKE
ncbi:MAG TPA: hypothetical protein PLU72_03585 [Candidatus Ozemobacteraceae bacterium]|nr:hypothetical protein [Candidatus Ozemobacteraceae bacterium]